LPSDSRAVTPAYCYNFVQFISHAKYGLFPFKKRTNFASLKFLQLFFTSNSVVFVGQGAQKYFLPQGAGHLSYVTVRVRILAARVRVLLIWRLSFLTNRAACLTCLNWVPNLGGCNDACLSSDVTHSFRLHDKNSSLDMLSTITVVKKHAETSVKNDASGSVED